LNRKDLKPRIFIAGSTYLDEDEILIPAFKDIKARTPNFKVIIVPHELQNKRLLALERLCAEYRLSAKCETEIQNIEEYKDYDIIIFNKIGLLYQIYKLGDICFVGGSFHGSIHNIMEPAVYKKLIVFGPTYRNAFEALYISSNSGAAVFNNSTELVKIVEAYYNDNASEYRKMPEISYNIAKKNLGSSERIYNDIKRFI